MEYKNKILFLENELTKFTVPNLQEKFTKLKVSELEFLDLSNISSIDSAGVAFLDALRLKFEKFSPQIVNVSKEIEVSILTFSSVKIKQSELYEPPRFLEKLGGWLIQFLNDFKQFFLITADTFYWAIVGIFSKKGQRKGEFISQSILIGVNALPIIALVSFLIGFILALQSAEQLRQVGANIFVADLIAIAMTREMAPIMTAIILAGRSGSAIASEIATMKISEEIDALKTMALNPIKYVVLPKLYAITLCTPLLNIFSIVVGISGGFLIGITYLKLSPTAFINEVANIIAIRDIVTSLIKSFVFAWLILLVGIFFGFRAKGGAEGVGKATTSAVVASIFMVIVADSILGLIFY
ncbi:MAG: MlaE family lipid ABC transporter permease subunit [Candidatus Cloacimonetes bacterium]|nr:MlaE family lipid ABC transporter permease subunit [Candidatus Cloacimonadota bacterium]